MGYVRFFFFNEYNITCSLIITIFRQRRTTAVIRDFFPLVFFFDGGESSGRSSRQSCPVDTHSPPKPPPLPPLGQHHQASTSTNPYHPFHPSCYDCVFILFIFFYWPSPATAFSGWFCLIETNFHSNPPTTRPLDLWQSSLNTYTFLWVWVRAWRAAVRRTLKYNMYV